MKFRVALYQSEEGYSVNVPSLPGCWSQGETEAEATCRTSPTRSESMLDSRASGRNKEAVDYGKSRFPSRAEGSWHQSPGCGACSGKSRLLGTSAGQAHHHDERIAQAS